MNGRFESMTWRESLLKHLAMYDGEHMSRLQRDIFRYVEGNPLAQELVMDSEGVAHLVMKLRNAFHTENLDKVPKLERLVEEQATRIDYLLNRLDEVRNLCGLSTISIG